MSDQSRHEVASWFRAAPLAPVAVGLAVGIFLDRWIAVPMAIGVALFAACCMAAGWRALRRRAGVVLVVIAAVCVGAALHGAAARFTPATSIERLATQPPRLVRIAGTIASEPRLAPRHAGPFSPWSFRRDRTVFLLDVDVVMGLDGPERVCGRIRVSVREAVLALRHGETVEVTGWLSALRGPDNWGGFDWAAYQRRHGVVAVLTCSSRGNIRVLNTFGRRDSEPVSTRLRRRLRSLLTDDLSASGPDGGDFLSAMILGQRSAVDRQLNEVFIRSGCIHFLAVSGVHVLIVMCCARLAASVLPLRRHGHTVAMLLAVVAYSMITEPRPPILRATVLAVLYCVSRLVGRQRSSLNWLSAAAILLLVWSPRSLFDAGFQLSFLACLGVSCLSPALVMVWEAVRGGAVRVASFRRSSAHTLAIKLKSWEDHSVFYRFAAVVRGAVGGKVVAALGVSCGAWLATAPVVAVHFGRIQPWGAVNSCLVMPLVTLVMALGFCKLFAQALTPQLGWLFGVPLSWAEQWLLGLVGLLGGLPLSTIDVAAPSSLWCVACYAFLTTLIIGFRRHGSSGTSSEDESRKDRVARRWPAAAGAVVILAVTAVDAWPAARPDRLTVTTLSVGEGLALVVELPDGRTLLYDVGSSSLADAGQTAMNPYLRFSHVGSIDSVFLSHPNLDHYNGLPSVCDVFPVGKVVVNDYFEARADARSPSRLLLDLIDERGVAVETLSESRRTWKQGGVKFEFLWPVGAQAGSLSANDSSMVLRLTYAGRSILLTGDIEERAQRALLDRGGLHADVLVLPHHGGIARSLGEFVAAVDPDVVIRSGARRRADGTPDRLSSLMGTIRLYDTAEVGAIRVGIDRDGLHVDCRRPAPGGAAGAGDATNRY